MGPELHAPPADITGPRPLHDPPAGRWVRPTTDGKFLRVGEERLWIRGVTYGTFAPDAAGDPLPPPDVVARDFARMAEVGVNAVRTYTAPPWWLLDEAARHGLWVMAGLAWEQHVTFLDQPARRAAIVERVREDARSCAAHPALLAFAVGNEIPASIVRWSGARGCEAFIHRLCDAVREEDPGALLTYVNYPSTEFLRLPFLDFVGFNVYLERVDELTAYLARLQNLAADRPLLMTEIGRDSRRAGLQGQAESVAEQIGAAFAGGCAGAFVFSWTDEWHRGGREVVDWDFGLTARDRSPKPALAAAGAAFARGPLSTPTSLPGFSVVVCAYNAERTLGDCLDGVAALAYPDVEVIVVDDGSTDATAAIADRPGVHLVRTENRGLARARNTGIAAATRELVAFIDADARPDPLWLLYLALTFRSGDWVGVGGPNVAPPGDGLLASCVANAPGGPIHVLTSDTEAEHVPGCNMAFRREALLDVDGFDPRFRIAGDDVDLCWRLLERGGRLGFSPAALVWHHCRGSLGAFWRQQREYGRAEALLEAKWPEKYNSVGHVTWGGRVYGHLVDAGPWGGRIYGGTWGLAPFQFLDPRPPHPLVALAGTPEWLLLLAVLTGAALLGLAWPPLLAALPLLLVGVGAVVARAGHAAVHARFPEPARSTVEEGIRRGTVALLHVLQPLARLRGRVAGGLTPWRSRGGRGFRPPVDRSVAVWSEAWRSPAERLERIRTMARGRRVAVGAGGPWDPWDLELKAGLLGRIRLNMAVEEHGRGRQMLRFRLRPRVGLAAVVGILLPLSLAVAAALDGAPGVAAVLAGAAAVVLGRTVFESGVAMHVAMGAVAGHQDRARAPAAEPRPTPRTVSAAVGLQEAG